MIYRSHKFYYILLSLLHVGDSRCCSAQCKNFNAFYIYAKKKFKQAGLRVFFDDSWFDLSLGSNPNRELQQSRYQQYRKDLSKLLGRASRMEGTSGYHFKIFLPKVSASVDDYWERKSIFDVELYLTGVQNEIKVIVRYSDAFGWLRDHHGLAVDDTFISEEGLLEVYKLIDLIAKSIRLISVE